MRILIIIDNLTQYARIKTIIEKRKLPNVYFEFRHSAIKSAIWDHPDFKNSNNSIIDVKNEYKVIIDSFNLVISVHSFQLFPKQLVKEIRCINIHPGYNPINRGWYPQVFAIINSIPIGATIHEMDEFLDNGPIIAREFVETYSWDTSESIYNRVLEKEMVLFESKLEDIVYNRYKLIAPENTGNLFLKKDFKNLCEIKLDETTTYRNCINKLRALTHGEYLNAYFIDEITGEKIYLQLNLVRKNV